MCEKSRQTLLKQVFLSGYKMGFQDSNEGVYIDENQLAEDFCDSVESNQILVKEVKAE